MQYSHENNWNNQKQKNTKTKIRVKINMQINMILNGFNNVGIIEKNHTFVV